MSLCSMTYKARNKALTQDRNSFESEAAFENCNYEKLESLLDINAILMTLGVRFVKDKDALLNFLLLEGLIYETTDDTFVITNLAALMYGKDLSACNALYRRGLRVIIYEHNNKLSCLSDTEFTCGYALSFFKVMDYFENFFPKREIFLKNGLRSTVLPYSLLAIKEILVNAIIHQSFDTRGTGPVAEIFKDRIEITSTGNLNVDKEHLVDGQNIVNTDLFNLASKIRLCEGLGLGLDRAVADCKAQGMSAIKFENLPEMVRVTLYAKGNL